MFLETLSAVSEVKTSNSIPLYFKLYLCIQLKKCVSVRIYCAIHRWVITLYHERQQKRLYDPQFTTVHVHVASNLSYLVGRWMSEFVSLCKCSHLYWLYGFHLVRRNHFLGAKP